jgi:hypothetical protein
MKSRMQFLGSFHRRMPLVDFMQMFDIISYIVFLLEFSTSLKREVFLSLP